MFCRKKADKDGLAKFITHELGIRILGEGDKQ